MLIEFQVENFRSFKERQVLSMVADASTDRVAARTFDSGLKGFSRVLRSAVIYGPNAAGKTNLLRAIQCMQTMVVNSAATSASSNYPYSPFKLSSVTSGAPSEFQVTFIQNHVRYEYGFTMGPEQVETEWLMEYVTSSARTRGRMLFRRSWDRRKKQHIWKFSSFLKGQRLVWSEATRPDALFLSTAIQLNSTQLRPVFDWFQKRLVVIVGPTTMNQALTLRLLNEPDGKEQVLPFLQEADLGIADISVKRERIPSGGLIVGAQQAMIDRQLGSEPNLVRITLSHLTDDLEVSGAMDFADESSGTQILFNMAGAWLNVFSKGEVLLFDEIDTNLHPKLLTFLIQKFHSEKYNPKNAQLICSTHNTSLLDHEVFRRDQIWFVDKERGGASKLYPLTDFHPRTDEVIERWYLRGRYGALPVLAGTDDSGGSDT